MIIPAKTSKKESEKIPDLENSLFVKEESSTVIAFDNSEKSSNFEKQAKPEVTGAENCCLTLKNLILLLTFFAIILDVLTIWLSFVTFMEMVTDFVPEASGLCNHDFVQLGLLVLGAEFLLLTIHIFGFLAIQAEKRHPIIWYMAFTAVVGTGLGLAGIYWYLPLDILVVIGLIVFVGGIRKGDKESKVWTVEYPV